MGLGKCKTFSCSCCKSQFLNGRNSTQVEEKGRRAVLPGNLRLPYLSDHLTSLNIPSVEDLTNGPPLCEHNVTIKIGRPPILQVKWVSFFSHLLFHPRLILDN